MRKSPSSIFAITLGLACASCVPSVSQQERVLLQPVADSYSTTHTVALREVAEAINESSTDRKIVIQPLAITTSLRDAELPVDITSMVNTSLAHLIGKRVSIVPFKDDYLIARSTTYGLKPNQIAWKKPNYLLAGQITEFEPNLEVRISSMELDILFGDGTADVYGDVKDRWQEQRLTLDLHLLDGDEQYIIEGAFVSNSVRIVELEKTREFGFAIAGSGPTLSGRIAATEGLHRAIRHLVNYSVLQLISLLEGVPYWVVLGAERDESVMAKLRSDFRNTVDRNGRRYGVRYIQEALNTSFPIEQVYDRETGETYHGLLQPTGYLDEHTAAYLRHFVETFDPSIRWNDLPQVYAVMIEYSSFSPETNDAYRRARGATALRPTTPGLASHGGVTQTDSFDYILSIAREQLVQEHYQSAIKLADTVLQRDPSNPAAAEIRNQAQRALGRIYDAVEIQ